MKIAKSTNQKSNPGMTTKFPLDLLSLDKKFDSLMLNWNFSLENFAPNGKDLLSFLNDSFKLFDDQTNSHFIVNGQQLKPCVEPSGPMPIPESLWLFELDSFHLDKPNSCDDESHEADITWLSFCA